MRVADLFCGCGGISAGFQAANHEIVFAAENWSRARLVYDANFDHGSTKLDLGDIVEAAFAVSRERPEVIVGGPPCQDFSAAGRRTEASRADLTVGFAEIVRACRPIWFVMENVPAAAASRAWRSARVRQAFALTRGARVRDLNLSDIRSLDPSRPIGAARIAVINLKKWELGRTLTCRFLDGDTKQKSKVQEKALIWEQYANTKFKFVAAGDAEIRISFRADPGSWSAVGTDCLVERYFPKYQPTMNFGWLGDDTDDNEYERVVVHEFGHALGCIHEHQSPTATLQWDTAAVYRVFSGPPNFWTKEDIDFNILEKYSPEGVSATRFDKKSIMLYQFDKSLFVNGEGTPLNTQLSDLDKQMIAQMYPQQR